MLDVLAHNGNRDLMLRIANPMHQLLIITHLQRIRFQTELLTDQVVNPVIHQSNRHFVDRELRVNFFNDRPLFHIAKQSNLVRVLTANRLLCPHNQYVRLNPNLTQLLHTVLRRFRLGFASSLQVGNQSQMNKETAVLANVQGDLTNRLQKRQTLDVTHSPAQFGNHNIHTRLRQAQNRRFNLVRNVRHYLHSTTQIHPATLLVDHR